MAWAETLPELDHCAQRTAIRSVIVKMPSMLGNTGHASVQQRTFLGSNMSGYIPPALGQMLADELFANKID